jgi:ATP-dependent DNA ligase
MRIGRSICSTQSHTCSIIASFPLISSFSAGDAIFRRACGMGLEGIVAKRRDRPYRSGRSPDWIKVKNPEHRQL